MSAKSIMRKAVEIYLVLFASVHLLYFGFSGYSHIFEAKRITFCTITSLLLICAIISAFLYVFHEKNSLPTRLKAHASHARICALFYIFFTLVSGFISSHFPDTIFGVSRFEGMFTTAYYVFSFLLISLFPCNKKYIFTVFSICVTLFSIICVLQISGLNPFSLYPVGTSFYDAGVRYTTAFLGTIGNTNLCGAFICIALPFLAVIMLKAKAKTKWLLIIPVVLLTFIALKMDVTSTILALAVTALIAIPCLFGFDKKITAIYISVLVILFALITVTLYLVDFGGSLGEIHSILHGEISESFGSGRIRIWKNVLSEIPDSLFFGKGPDTMKRANFPTFESYYPALGKIMKTNIDVAHNEPLNILYHRGIFALIFYVGFIVSILRIWLRNRSDVIILALGLGFIGYLIQSMFTFSMCLTAPYFWICGGLIVGFSKENLDKAGG